MFRLPFLITAVFAAATTVPLQAAEPGGARRGNRDAAAPSTEATRLYGQYCLSCHGADGKGTAMKPTMPTIPDYTDRTWQESRTDASLLISILDGKGTLMPAFADRLTAEQVREQVSYVRAFAPTGNK